MRRGGRFIESTGVGDPDLRQAVAIAAIFLVLLADAALGAAGIELRPLLHLPGPLGGPWLFALLLLGLLRWNARHDRPLRRRPLPAGDLLPLALAVVAAGSVLAGVRPLVVAWTQPPAVPASLSAPLFRLGMGGALLTTVVLLMVAVPRFRRRLRELASTRRLRSGLFFTVAVMAVMYAILLGLGHLVAGPGKVRFEIPVYVPASLAIVLGQAAIALGEEAFYRGLLQGEVTRLFGRAGMRKPRDRRLAALLSVSVLFALHHVGPGMPVPVFLSVLVYSFAMSVLFGFLFDLTHNLAVCALAHLFNNLMVLRLGPWLAAPEQVEAFGDGVYVAAFLLVAFTLLFLLSRDSSESLRPIRPS